ncbi:AzlC family ABC transporter permease [Breoghania sp. L-A4]|uniref:AzlC family ABC transporter permease n=1 Tax=Breoghania sp. L-A4 TaxID=2304600 RepID=UPI0020BEF079|nr:AzlC family ABC transporter permease [Breoghania sp. L-A4]
MLEISLMSAIVFAGSAQFVAVDIWSSPAPWAALGFSALLINMRHVLMSASIAPKMGGFHPAARILGLFFLADEIWALSEARAARERFTPAFYFGLITVFYVFWNFWSVLGALIGPALGDPVDTGFDFAFTAIFIALIVNFWKGPSTGAVLVASAATAALVHQLVAGPWYILAGAIAGMIAAALAWRPEPDAPRTEAVQGDWSADVPGARLEPEERP